MSCDGGASLEDGSVNSSSVSRLSSSSKLQLAPPHSERDGQLVTEVDGGVSAVAAGGGDVEVLTAPVRPRRRSVMNVTSCSSSSSSASNSSRHVSGSTTVTCQSRDTDITSCSLNSSHDDSGSGVLLIGGSDSGTGTGTAGGSMSTSTYDCQQHQHAAMLDQQKLRELVDVTHRKMAKCKEGIKQEQRIRDGNVDEYLRMTASITDRQQQQKMKVIFEKKNQKSSQHMALLQRKLESYSRRLHELDTCGAAYKPPKGVLKDVGQGLKTVGGNIRHGITELSGSVMSKPREIAHLLKNRFGSADNISTLAEESPDVTPTRSHHGSATLPAGIPSISSVMNNTGVSTARSEEGSDISSVASEGAGVAVGGASSPRALPVTATVSSATDTSSQHLAELLSLLERREDADRLREDVDTIKSTLQQEVGLLSQQLHDERERHEALEQQLNDFIELHQNEIENLRQQISDTEEKIQYQSDERLRDVHELLDKCSTRILRMEQQQAEHQQLVNLEVIGNSQARALVVKLVNCVLTVLQVVLLIVATGVSVARPFISSRGRVVCSVVVCVLAVGVSRYWSSTSQSEVSPHHNIQPPTSHPPDVH